MLVLHRLLCVFIGYLFGLFQTAYILGKANNVDIREYGSGNSGTTNAMRTLGKKAGVITYLGDAFKTIIAVIIVRILFKDCDYLFVLVLYTGFGAILGHNFPFYMNFKGGKGIAASSGVIISLFDWKLLLAGIVTFAVVLLVSRYVSLSSLCVMTGLLIEVIVFGELGLYSQYARFNDTYKWETYIIVFMMTVLAFVRHKENIIRLKNGTERKIGEKKEAV